MIFTGTQNYTYQWRIQDFTEEGAPTPRGGGRQHTILPKFPKKPNEIERIWTPGGGRGGSARPLRPPLDQPLHTPKYLDQF